jgi:hypothetical protein
MRLRRVSALVGFLLLVPGAVTVAVLSSPADAAVPAAEGTLLALDPDPELQYFQFESVTNNYFTFLPGPPSEREGQKWQVRGTGDGSVAVEVPPTPPNYQGAPELVGRSMVTRTATADGTKIAFTGLAGAPAAGAVTVPSADTILAVHEKGVLVEHADQVQVRTADGTVRQVTGLPYLQIDARVVDRDGDTLLLRNYQQLYTIDVTTAAATLIAETPLPLTWAELTPTRIVWAATDSRSQLDWKPRDGSAGGSVDTPTKENLTTLGDDVAILRIPSNGTHLRREVVRLHLPGGEIGQPLLGDVADAQALEDGRILVAQSNAVVALLPAGGLKSLAQIAPKSRGASEVVISNGTVLTAFEDGLVRQTTLNASQWTTRTDIPVTSGTGNGLQIGGDTVFRARDMVVRWPAGQRQLNTNGAAELGRGGGLLSYMSFADQSTYQIQNPRTGVLLTTRPTSRPIAMDGQWVWQAPDPATGVLTGEETVTKQIKTVPSSVRCGAGTFAVAGRWALVKCSVHEQYVVDLLGTVATYRLPDNAPAENLHPQLGDGFVARLRFTPNGQGIDVPELLVTDLNSPTHAERVVGPVRGRVWPPGASFAADDKAARIAYVDPESRIRVATLDWLAAPPPATLDTVAPKFASATAGARVSLTSPVRYSYKFSDNVAVASYDVVYRAAAAGRLLGKWTFPLTWQAIKGAAVSVTPAPGTDACFMVRARDARGNLSAWSPVTCSLTPHDDRAFAATVSFARLTYRTAYRGTLTQLRRSGAAAYKDGETGNRVAVTALTAPKQGVVDVYVAGTKVGRIYLTASTVSLRTFYLPVGAFRTGRVIVKSVSASPASIDAVGLLRA